MKTAEKTEISSELIEQMTKILVDGGKIIEAGWVGLKLETVSPLASEAQIREMRNFFFAGAQHLFYTIMTMLEPGEEATEKDESRMTQISKELKEFIDSYYKEQH